MQLSETLKQERAFVEKSLASKCICERCKCRLDNFADKCTAGLQESCPGFEAIEEVKAQFHKERKS